MNDYNASDLKDIRRAAKAAKQALADRRSVVYSLMSNPAGRNWMYDRLERCHVFSSSFSLNALSMAFSEGERNIGLQDLNDIMQFAPDQYIQMTREATDRNQADGRRTDPSGHLGDNPERGRDDLGRTDDPVGSGTVESEYDPVDGDRDDFAHGGIQGTSEGQFHN